MDLLISRVFEDILHAWVDGQRRILLEGGTASTKTWSALQALITIQEKSKTPFLMSVVSESLPHLRKGAMRDFFNILGESSDNNRYWSKTECIYHRPEWKGSIEFFGVEDADKVKGPRRDILFINEGNNIPWETARGLDIRTKVFTIVDWNPTDEFWAHKNWIGRPGNVYSHSTYLQGKEIGVLGYQTVKDIESYKDSDPNWWNIYGLGLIGRIEGLVFPVFNQVDRLPDTGDEVVGIDFGFSGDPAVVTIHKLFERSKEVYSQELIYELGLTNPQLSSLMETKGLKKRSTEIFADSAEPKSIEELYNLGWNIKPCPKGPGSVEFRHQKTRQYKQHWTRDSVNCIKEQRNFRYIKDKNGELTEKTTHKYSHGMDSRDYAIVGKTQPAEFQEEVVVYDSMQLVDRDIKMRI